MGAKVAGRVKQVNVDLGSVVKKDGVLVLLEQEDFDHRVQQAEAQLEQARAKLGLQGNQNEDSLDRSKVPTVVQQKALVAEAKREFARAKDLMAGNAIAMEEVQQRESALAVAEARSRAVLDEVDELVATVKMRRAQLALALQARTDATVRAPFDGVVQYRHVAPGSYLDVGDPIVTLVRTDPLRFHGGIPEREVPFVRLRQEVRIRIEGEESPVSGQVTRLCPALDTSSRSLVVQVDIPNPDSRLRSGVFAEAEIIIDPEARTLAVPASAVREFAGIEKVWVARNGEAVQQVVETGRRSAGRIEILAGLSLGDMVVVDHGQGRAGRVVAEEKKEGGGRKADGGRRKPQGGKGTVEGGADKPNQKLTASEPAFQASAHGDACQASHRLPSVGLVHFAIVLCPSPVRLPPSV